MNQALKAKNSIHVKQMKEAIKVAEACTNIEWYGVGCIITSPEGEVICSSYTNELSDENGKGLHAEEGAIEKAREQNLSLKDCTLYSTLEPCSIRASGKEPCVSKILSTELSCVVYGAKEPYDSKLGIKCEGDKILRENGIKVVYLEEIAEECFQSTISKREARQPR